jgi:hypothetical protein
MRKPTPRDELYAWHRNALLGVYGDDLGLSGEVPHCGWFKRRLVKGGVMVPARIWMFQPICPFTGDLTEDEALQCEVNGAFADAHHQWPWLCAHPIPEHEFLYLEATRAHCAAHEPHDPIVKSFEPVNWLTVPASRF